MLNDIQESKALKILSRIISTVFVPPVPLLIGFYFIALTEEQSYSKRAIVFGISFVFGFLLPTIVFLSLYFKGRLKDMDASEKDQRTLPYLVGLLLVLCALLLLRCFGGDSFSQRLWISYGIALLAILIINRKWKISAHSMGISIPLGAFFCLGNALWPWLLLILFLVASSRLILHQHSLLQVILGGLAGFLVSCAVFTF